MSVPIVPTQRFIPFSCHDVEGICRATNFVPSADFESHRQLFAKLINLEYQALLDTLKLAYAPYNPDIDTKPWQIHENEELELSELVHQVLVSANYEQLTQQDLVQAMNDNSLFNIKLDVKFDEFSKLLVFTRGEHMVKREVKRIGRFGRKTIQFTNYERVFIFLQYQDRQWFIDNKRAMSEHIKPGAVMLKLFKDVPKADIETLFPNSKIKMRNLDKLLIGIPAIASGGIILATKLGATMLLVGALISFYLGLSDKPVELNQQNLLVLAAGLATLGGYFWKQFSAFKNKKIRFMQTLSESLYYKALDNNVGVFHYLIDSAKESECKELILAWTFMQKLQRATAQELDSAIEDYFAQSLDTVLDFDVEDALSKLCRFELVSLQSGIYSACSPRHSYQHLLARWHQSATV